MKQLLTVIITFYLIGCNTPPSKNLNAQDKSQDNLKTTILDTCDSKTKDSTLRHLQKASDLGFEPTADKLSQHESNKTIAKPTNKLIAFKRIVREELKNKADSLIINDSLSIQKIHYLEASFNINQIDSIEFYGRDIQGQRKERMIPMRTAVIIYTQSPAFFDVAFDSLKLHNRTTMRNLEWMFKPGGIVFKTDEALVLYSINACGPGYKNVRRIDNLIKRKVFNSADFYRLHNGCGMDRMKEIRN